MRHWLEIQTTNGVDKREVKPDGETGVAQGSCPGCKATPFLVRGSDLRRHSHDTYVANGRCVGCSDAVGYLYAKVDTIFGTEEDMAVGLRARVY